MAADADRQSLRFRAVCSIRGAGRRDHVAWTDLWPAHAVHVVHCRARDRAPHHRRPRRPPPATAASSGRVGPGRRRDERVRARARVDLPAGPCAVRARDRPAPETSAFRRRGVKVKLCVLALTALVIWAMKRHYADAGADDLWWILTPTTQVVSAMTGAAFVAVPSEGYVSHERLFVIEKSCAGINFQVAAFGMLVIPP